MVESKQQAKEIIAARLTEVAKELPWEVKMTIGIKNGISQTTMYRYTNGRVANITVGRKLVEDMESWLKRNKAKSVIAA
jgi:hypothetical protein